MKIFCMFVCLFLSFLSIVCNVIANSIGVINDIYIYISGFLAIVYAPPTA